MAASLQGVFDSELQEKILNAKVFVVGAGGIGCELLKNLVLVGLKDIEVIDLDTIDVSNLNRQFLFHKQHVGKSKAAVATESALQFNPNVKIKYYHDSVIKNDYNVNFFKRFDVVLNALDNLTARNHVNRMCLAAGVPLVESGTAGYEGQVELIKKGLTRCYECEVKRLAKSYPGCTIRNTPSEPIHCIVWAKHLFNQLFGESNLEDEDVSPDAADPELAGQFTTNGAAERKSTRGWAEESSYDPALIFKKLFHDDIVYLLKMDKLWEKRRRPTPLEMDAVPDAVAGSSKEASGPGLKEMRVWSVAECVEVFRKAVPALKTELQRQGEGSHLIWDKDDQTAMDFVAACANIRSHIFGIVPKTRFEIKSMAGNIIPAIASTNAIVAGVVVLRLLDVIRQKFENCTTVYLRMKPNLIGQMIVSEKKLTPPNPKCYTCAPNPQVTLACNTNKMTIFELQEAVLKKTLNMTAPDVILATTGAVILSSEEGETDESYYNKTLSEMGISDGSVLKSDDFLQNYELSVVIKQYEAEKDKPEFIVDSDGETFGPKPETEKKVTEDDDNDPMIMETEGESVTSVKRKLPSDSDTSTSPPKKRLRDLEIEPDVIVL